jgi:protein TonB
MNAAPVISASLVGTQPAKPAVAARKMKRRMSAEESPEAMVAMATSVVWVLCAVIGLFGFVLPYVRAKRAAAEPAPLIAQKIEVELAPEPPVLDPLTPPDPNTPPPPPDAVVQPQLPTPVAVAKPSPAIAFAVPVEGPVRIVQAKQATHVIPPAPKTNAVATARPVQAQQLVHGSGEGVQAQPTYPRRAAQEGQEGTVVVWMSVGPDGRVIDARAIQPSPWPLLNDEAVRVVKNKWRFQTGAMRAFEVPIRFQLEKR